jgi:hypothetical protein
MKMIEEERKRFGEKLSTFMEIALDNTRQICKNKEIVQIAVS